MEYYIHVTLDAISHDDIELWRNLPNELGAIYGVEEVSDFPGLVESKNVGGRVTDYANLDWTIVNITGDRVFLYSDPFTNEFIKELGFDSDADGKVKYYRDGETEFTGYENSNIADIIEKFQEEHLYAQLSQTYVYPIEILMENVEQNNTAQREDAPVFVDYSSGWSRAFLPSVSDLNY